MIAAKHISITWPLPTNTCSTLALTFSASWATAPAGAAFEVVGWVIYFAIRFSKYATG